MSLPADIEAVLARLEPAILAAFMESVAAVQSAAQLQLIVEHLRAGNVDMALAALKMDAAFFGPLDRAIGDAFYQGGVMALAGLPKIPDPFPGAGWSSASTAGTPERRPGRRSIPGG